MEADLRVEVDELRQRGSGVTRTAHRVAGGLVPAPPLAVSAPGWSTATAIARLAELSTDGIAALAERIGATGERLSAAAEGYDRADERAAQRLLARAV